MTIEETEIIEETEDEGTIIKKSHKIKLFFELVGLSMLHIWAYGSLTFILVISWSVFMNDAELFFTEFGMEVNIYGKVMFWTGFVMCYTFFALFSCALIDSKIFMELKELKKKAENNA